MKHYDFAVRFRAVYDQAVGLYAKGQRGADSFFAQPEKDWLAANGITSQHIYDYAEDQVGYGEPGFDIALTIEVVRRNYFLNAQGGRPSSAVLDESRLPGKTEAVRGVEWLPRLIPKALAKLRGELPPGLMYCCGGDRRFFKAHDIFPAEFLSLVWRRDGDEKSIVDWVLQRKS
jgi:hypothetical protein